MIAIFRPTGEMAIENTVSNDLFIRVRRLLKAIDCCLPVVSIQLMHSFEINIKICQPVNSYVDRGEADVNITFEG